MSLRSFFFLLLFLVLFLPIELFYNVFRNFAAIVPDTLTIPSSFHKKIAFFPAQLILIALLCICLHQFRKQWFEFFWTGPSKYLSLLALAAFVSIVTSSGYNYPLIYTRFFAFCLSLTLFPLLCRFFNSETLASFLKKMAFGFFILSFFECAIALLQYFSQGPIGLKFLGEGNAQHARFFMPDEYGRWIFDPLFSIHRESIHFFRSVGTFAHPNIFGAFLFITLLFTLYLYFNTSKRHWILFLGLFLQILTLTLTFSRAAILSFFLCTLFWFALQWSTVDKRPALKQLSLMVIGSSALCLTLFYPQLRHRGGIINYNHLVKKADAERLSYQRVAWEMVQEHPFFGVGFDQFELEAPRYFQAGKVLPFKVHNIYFLVAAEIGLFGALFFFLFLFYVLKRSMHQLQRIEGLFLFTLFSGLLLLGCCDFYFLTTPHGQILFFGIAALLYANTKACAFSPA